MLGKGLQCRCTHIPRVGQRPAEGGQLGAFAIGWQVLLRPVVRKPRRNEGRWEVFSVNIVAAIPLLSSCIPRISLPGKTIFIEVKRKGIDNTTNSLSKINYRISRVCCRA